MFFDLSWSHILILLVVTLVVVGPKDLPKMMRMVGRWTGKARAMANQLRKSFDEMARQSELDELRAEIQALRQQRPLADLEQSLHQSILPPELPQPAETPLMTAHEPQMEMAEREPAAHETPAREPTAHEQAAHDQAFREPDASVAP
jgi:sec-independent protein translocase protein TatB